MTQNKHTMNTSGMEESSNLHSASQTKEEPNHQAPIASETKEDLSDLEESLAQDDQEAEKEELVNRVTNVIKKDPDLLERIVEDKEVRRVMVSRSVFQGPLPPPSILEGYEGLLPGATNRLISLVESQQAHRHLMESENLKLERTAVEGSINRDVINGKHAFWLAFFVLASCLVLGITGHDTLAGIFGTTTIATILVVFVLNKFPDFMNRNKEENHEEKDDN